jgi:hypothetical protein
MIAFACTLGANTAVLWLQRADLCRAGPFVVPLLSLGAFAIFALMAAAAGFATGRATATGSDPTLAGPLVGAIAGCAVVALLPFIPSVQHRFQELSALCPGSFLSGSGSFSFNFGPTPPPDFGFPTPPPEAFVTAPPGAFAVPAGPGGTVGEVLGMVTTIVIGVGVAVGIATLTGLTGRAIRSDESR